MIILLYILNCNNYCKTNMATNKETIIPTKTFVQQVMIKSE